MHVLMVNTTTQSSSRMTRTMLEDSRWTKSPSNHVGSHAYATSQLIELSTRKGARADDVSSRDD